MQQQPSRPIRVVIAELKQESNSFAPQATGLAQFEDFHLRHGAELLEHLRETNTEIGGFLDICAEQSWQVEPLLAAFAVSGGPLTTATITALREELLSRLQAVPPVEAVLLALHGAMVAEDDDDPDGTTMAAVRAMIGPDLPLLASLDLHANLTHLMVDAADALVGFRTCPHIDQRETGQRTAHLLAGWLATPALPA